VTRADPCAEWRNNPFFVLELEADASRLEVERAGQRLLGLLAIGAQGADEYQTPFGPARRDADTVRQALSRLRDPLQRVRCELWANVNLPPLAAPESGESLTAPWEIGARALGWRQP
jgi:hypothetical protein